MVGCAECELAQCIADYRRERRYTYVDFHNVRDGGRAVSDLVPRPERTGSAVTVNVQASLVAAALPQPPAPLTVSCPANMSVASSNGSPVVVTYSATTSGGVAPVTVSGSPASGSSFQVGTTNVTVTAQSSDGQITSCGFQ